MFKEILKDAVAGTIGATGAIFVDGEGESVGHFFRGPEYDIKLLGAHCGILLGLVREAAGNIGQGEVRCMVLATDDAKVVVQPLKDGYSLVMLLDGRANTGMALRGAMRAAKILMEEI